MKIQRLISARKFETGTLKLLFNGSIYHLSQGLSPKMTKVAAVKPFASCFSSKGLGRWMMGSRVPVIELLLRGGAKWKIYGSNSLVKVTKDVVCLGFMDGGVNLTMGMIIGGYQMEDNFVEFDVKASKFSFTSSLLLINSSCSQSRHF